MCHMSTLILKPLHLSPYCLYFSSWDRFLLLDLIRSFGFTCVTAALTSVTSLVSGNFFLICVSDSIKADQYVFFLMMIFHLKVKRVTYKISLEKGTFSETETWVFDFSAEWDITVFRESL